MKGKKLVATKSLNEVKGISYRLQAMSYEVPERSEWDDLISTKSLNEVNGISCKLTSTRYELKAAPGDPYIVKVGRVK